MPERIDGFAGAPQSVYSDHFLDTQPVDGPIGYKLEAPPLHPVLTATTLPDDGDAHARWMREFRNLQVVIALLRDGFHPDSPGGTVRLRDDGTPVLDYPLTPYVFDGVRRAFLSMAEIQFAAGATRVAPVHGDGAAFASWREAKDAIAALRPASARHARGVRARDGRRAARSRSRARGGRRRRAPSPPAQPVRLRRLALPDVDRRQSAALHLSASPRASRAASPPNRRRARDGRPSRPSFSVIALDQST